MYNVPAAFLIIVGIVDYKWIVNRCHTFQELQWTLFSDKNNIVMLSSAGEKED